MAEPQDTLNNYLQRYVQVAGEVVAWGDSEFLFQVASYLTPDPPPSELVISARGVIFNKDCVLLVRNPEGEHIVPGGKRLAGEPVEDALRREVMEETGWLVSEPEQLGVWHFHHLKPQPPGYAYLYPDFLQVIYAAHAVKFIPTAKITDDYEIDCRFAPATEVLNMNFSQPSQVQFLQWAIAHHTHTKSCYHLRPASVEDSSALGRIQVDSYRMAYKGILPQDYLDHFTYEEETRDWRELLSGTLEDILLVAESEANEVVGYALGRAGATQISPYDCELVSLHVRASHQRKGIGRRLIGAIARRCRTLGCQSLLVWVLAENARARQLYESLGAQFVGHRQIELGSEVVAIEVAYGWQKITSLIHSITEKPVDSQDK